MAVCSVLVVRFLVGSAVVGLVLAVEVIGVVKGLVDLRTVVVGGIVELGQHGKGGNGGGGQHTVVSGVGVMKGGC